MIITLTHDDLNAAVINYIKPKFSNFKSAKKVIFNIELATKEITALIEFELEDIEKDKSD